MRLVKEKSKEREKEMRGGERKRLMEGKGKKKEDVNERNGERGRRVRTAEDEYKEEKEGCGRRTKGGFKPL